VGDYWLTWGKWKECQFEKINKKDKHKSEDFFGYEYVTLEIKNIE
jgi:hypothetical protein